MTARRKTNDPIRVGMIGTSWYADVMHLPILKSHPQAQVAAICGRNRTRADEMAGKYAIPQVFTDYAVMFKQCELDAVVIAVPEEMHHPITVAALDAGLHVLCEKPMAMTLAQAQAMHAKATSAGVKHMIYFTYRWLPHIRYLVQLLQEGFIGQCRTARFVYLANYARDGKYQWKWDRRHGLGALGDVGSHMIDLARLTVGDITQVQAHLATHVERPHPESQPYPPANDSANLMLAFENGAQGMIQLSAVAAVGEEKFISLHGDAGVLEVNFGFADPFVLRGKRDDEDDMRELPIPEDLLAGIDVNAGWFDRFTQLFTRQSVGTRQFIDCIAGDLPIAANFHEGMKAQAVIEAALESHQRGCWARVAM